MGRILDRYRRDLVRIRPAARAYLVGSGLMGAAHAVAWTLLARYLDALGYSKLEVGGMQSADSWGRVVVALPAALVLARRSARGVFVGSALVGGAAYTLFPFVARSGGFAGLSTYELLYAVNFVAGLAMTVHYVAIAPFLFRHTGPEERASVFGVAEAMRTLAAVVGAFGAGRAVQFAFARMADTDASAAVRDAAEATATGWAIVAAGVVAMLAAASYARIRDAAPSLQRGEPLLPVLRAHRGVLARFALPQLLVATGAGFCIPFLPLYFKDRFAFEPSAWGDLFAAGQVLMTLGFLLTPFAIGRFGYVRAMVVIELASIPFFLMLAFTGHVAVAAFAFLMRGALMNSTHPILKNLMMQATPPGAREVQTGVNATLWGFGWVVGPVVGGWVLERTGDDYSVLMLTTAGLYVVAAALSWILLSGVERRTSEVPLRTETPRPARANA